MAERAAVETEQKAYLDKAQLVVWTGLLNGDTGAPIKFPASAFKSIQFNGTFGAGGTIVLQGSNDGTNYYTLTDPQGNAISKTAAGLEAIEEICLWIRPSVTAGDGTTDLTATLLVRR